MNIINRKNRYTRSFTNVTGFYPELVKEIAPVARSMGLKKVAICVDNSLMDLMEKMDGKGLFTRNTKKVLESWFFAIANACEGGNRNVVVNVPYAQETRINDAIKQVSIGSLPITCKLIGQDKTFHYIFSDTQATT